MKRFGLGLLLAVIVFVVGGVSPVLAQTFPQPQGLVNDFAGLLSPAGKSKLEATLLQLEK